jgi:hypothetical protein
MAAKIMIMPRDRLAWHKQMCEDRELSHVAFRVSVCISGYFNSQTGRTFVGYDRIADDLGIDRATVHRAVQQLRSKSDKNPAGRGHLDVTSGGGRHVANEYRMILKTVAPERRNDGDTVAPARRNADANTVANDAQNRRTGATTTLTSPSEKNSSRARARPGDMFVLEDSDDAQAWSTHIRSQDKNGTLIVVTHDGQRGAWMPTRRPSDPKEPKMSFDEVSPRERKA